MKMLIKWDWGGQRNIFIMQILKISTEFVPPVSRIIWEQLRVWTFLRKNLGHTFLAWLLIRLKSDWLIDVENDQLIDPSIHLSSFCSGFAKAPFSMSEFVPNISLLPSFACISLPWRHLQDYTVEMSPCFSKIIWAPQRLPFCLEKIPGLITSETKHEHKPQHMRYRFAWVCVYDTNSMMKCRPLRKCQEATATPPICFWTLYRRGKELKQSSVHMLSWRCCGCWALANFSEEGQGRGIWQ